MAKDTNINIRVAPSFKIVLEQKAKELGYPSLTAFMIASTALNQAHYGEYILSTSTK
jgi:uncharacterized protein (DUF1778 family)